MIPQKAAGRPGKYSPQALVVPVFCQKCGRMVKQTKGRPRATVERCPSCKRK